MSKDNDGCGVVILIGIAVLFVYQEHKELKGKVEKLEQQVIELKQSMQSIAQKEPPDIGMKD